MAEEKNENAEAAEEPEAVEEVKEEEIKEEKEDKEEAEAKEEEAKPVFKAKKSEEFEPKIIGFLCNWCTASAADLAGTTRAQYPPNLHPIRVMCSGTVDPVYIIKALLSGADAVMVGGCHPGDCHYISGNYKARRRIAMLKAIFEALGLDDKRIWARWISASEGPEFAQAIRDITEETKKQGPSSMAANWAL